MIGDAVAAALPLMRSHAASLMVESCSIHRESSVWDEALQKTVTTWAPVAESVPCYVGDSSGARVLVTDEAVTADSPAIHAPHTLAGVAPDDRVTHSSGAVMWVTDVPLDPYPVETVLQCRWVK